MLVWNDPKVRPEQPLVVFKMWSFHKRKMMFNFFFCFSLGTSIRNSCYVQRSKFFGKSNVPHKIPSQHKFNLFHRTKLILIKRIFFRQTWQAFFGFKFWKINFNLVLNFFSRIVCLLKEFRYLWKKKCGNQRWINLNVLKMEQTSKTSLSAALHGTIMTRRHLIQSSMFIWIFGKSK